MESNGNPDMWGIATTFFSLVTGNAPDKVGRAAFLWPPQGEKSVNREIWKEFHRIILRATHENPTERFFRFDAMAEALFSPDSELPVLAVWPRLRHWKAFAASILLIGGLVVWSSRYLWQQPGVPAVTHTSASESPQFDTKLQAAASDFEALLKHARSVIFSEAPEIQKNRDDFKLLLEKLKTEGNAPMEEVRKTLTQMEEIAPAVHHDLLPVDHEEFLKYVHQLEAAINRVSQLSGNAEEHIRAQSLATRLEEEGKEFVSHVEDRFSGVTGQIDATENLFDISLAILRHGENQRRNRDEDAEITRMSDSIRKKAFRNFPSTILGRARTFPISTNDYNYTVDKTLFPGAHFGNKSPQSTREEQPNQTESSPKK